VLSVPLGMPLAIPVQPTVGTVTVSDLASPAGEVPSRHTAFEPTAPVDRPPVNTLGARTRSATASHTRSAPSSNISTQRTLAASRSVGAQAKQHPPTLQNTQNGTIPGAAALGDRALATAIDIGAALPCGASATVACCSTADHGAVGNHACAILDVRPCTPRGYEVLTHFTGYRTCEGDLAWQTASSIRSKAPTLRPRVDALIAAMGAKTTQMQEERSDAPREEDNATPAPTAAPAVAAAATAAAAATVIAPMLSLPEEARAGDIIPVESSAASTMDHGAAAVAASLSLPLTPQSRETARAATVAVNDAPANAGRSDISSAHLNEMSIEELGQAIVQLRKQMKIHAERDRTSPERVAQLQRTSVNRIQHTVVSGDNSQCFGLSVVEHFGMRGLDQVFALAFSALRDINDPVTLCQWGLDIAPDATSREIQAAKEAYLSSKDAASKRMGGTLEMYLLSQACGGTVAFRIIDSIRHKTYFICTLPEDDARIRKEIPLHHCDINGTERADVRPNHWNTFTYHMMDGTAATKWTHQQAETALQRKLRVLRLFDAAKEGNRQVRETVRAELQESLALARYYEAMDDDSEPEPQRPSTTATVPPAAASSGPLATSPHRSTHPRSTVGSSLPLRVTSPSSGSARCRPATGPSSGSASRSRNGSANTATRNNRHRDNRRSPTQRRLTFAPAAASTTGSRPCNGLRSWRNRRVNTYREIYTKMSALYCDTASRLCEHYLSAASAAQPDHSRRADLGNLLMEYTGGALFRGNHRATHSRHLDIMRKIGERTLTEAERVARANSPAPIETDGLVPMNIDPPDGVFSPAITDDDVIVLDSRHGASKPADRQDVPDHDDNVSDNGDATGTTSMLRLTRRTHFIVTQGGPHAAGRAAKTLVATPLAPLNANTLSKLAELHPAATEPMGELPDHAFAVGVVDARRLEAVLRRRVHNGSAPGVSGMTGSHLVAIWDKATPDGRLGFQMLIRDICNGVFDGELKERLLAAVLVPLSKPNQGVRPIAIAEVLVRCASFYMMSLIEDEMASFFPKIQFGVGLAGGSEAAAHLTRAELAYAGMKRSDIIALKIDFRNAFNAISRRQVWKALCAHPKAAPILRAFFWQYSDSSPLLIYERGELFHELRSSNGVRQGCPFAGFGFALSVQPLYVAALREAPTCQGFSIQDDFTIVGPYEEVMRAYDFLEAHAQQELGLELVTRKCQVYMPPTTLASAEAVDNIRAECTRRDLALDIKMESLGVMLGNEAAISAHCQAAVDASTKFFERVSHYSLPVQTASLLLRYCGVPKLGYLARTTHPAHLLVHARRFDQMALEAQMSILGLTHGSLTALEPRVSDPDCHIHDPGDPGDGDPPLPPGSQPLLTTERESRVTKEQLLKRIALPLHMGGMGLRTVESVRFAAYFASMQQILSYFIRLHPELQHANEFRATALYQEMSLCHSEITQATASVASDLSPLPSHPCPPPLSSFLTTAASTLPPPPPSHTAAAVSSVENNAAIAAAASSSSAATRSPSSTRVPTLLQNIDAIWQKATTTPPSTSSLPKLQHRLTYAMEDVQWRRLYHSCGRYQQALLISLTQNPSTSVWLTTPPLESEPGYSMSDLAYRLACRHRLGLLPFDDLRSKACVTCARRNIETPTLLADPDHAHSCTLQEGTSVKFRHDTSKMVVAGLSRSCGGHVIVEPQFPPRLVTELDGATGRPNTVARPPIGIHGDLLIVHNNTCQLIDFTVARPTQMTLLRGNVTDAGKTFTQPLIAAAAAEKRKHGTYDAECAVHGWKLVPFVMESTGALGTEALQLLERMSAHCTDRSPSDFLLHAHRMLSVALQSGNAHVASQGAAGILLCKYSAGSDGRGPGVHQRGRLARAAADWTTDVRSIVHAGYRCARVGVHTAA
jgi:hypothetical protein